MKGPIASSYMRKIILEMSIRRNSMSMHSYSLRKNRFLMGTSLFLLSESSYLLYEDRSVVRACCQILRRSDHMPPMYLCNQSKGSHDCVTHLVNRYVTCTQNFQLRYI